MISDLSKLVQLECVVVDDGSDIMTANYLDELAGGANFSVRIIHQQNVGQAVARLNGVGECSGDYVVFVDSDDLLDLNAVPSLLDQLQTHQWDAVGYGHHHELPDGTVYAQEKRIEHTLACADKHWLLRHCGCLWSYAYKRELFDDSNIVLDDSIRIGEDLAMLIPLLAKADRVLLLDDVIYRYVNRPESIYRKAPRERAYDVFKALDLLSREVEEEYERDVEWLYVFHAVVANGGAFSASFGMSNQLRDFTFKWLDGRYPDWREADFLQTDEVFLNKRNKLLLNGNWRTFYLLKQIYQPLKRLKQML